MIAGCGELHAEICLKDFRDEYAQCDFIMVDPMVSYRETVAGTSSQTGPSKSPNKRNLIYLVADLLPVVLSNTIESGRGGAKTDSKERAKIMKERFNRDENAARVWGYSPETEGAKVVVVATQDVQCLVEIKEHV